MKEPNEARNSVIERSKLTLENPYTQSVEKWLKSYSDFMKLILLINILWMLIIGGGISIACFIFTLISLFLSFAFYDSIRSIKTNIINTTETGKDFLFPHVFFFPMAIFLIVKRNLVPSNLYEGIPIILYLIYIIFDIKFKLSLEKIFIGK